MDQFFIIQLSISFIIGGFIIATLSFIAEKANENIAGIILAFPATLALGLFFLAWTTSAKTVAHIIPATFIPLGLGVCFISIYLYSALYFSTFVVSKIWQITLSSMISIIFWLIIAIPLTLIQSNNFIIGLTGYILLMLVSHYFLIKKNYQKTIPLSNYTVAQKIARAVFSGFIVFLVVLFGKILSPLWGGVFSIFPVTFLSSIIILHWYYDPNALFPIMKKSALGSLSIFSYMITVMITFPLFDFIIGTIMSYIVSLLVMLLIINLQQQSFLIRKKIAPKNNIHCNKR